MIHYSLLEPEDQPALYHRCLHEWIEAYVDGYSITERMKHFHRAFPYAYRPELPLDGDSLVVSWDCRHRAFILADHGGFLTLLPGDELDLLKHLLEQEACQKGSLRLVVTGEPVPLPIKPPPKPVAAPPRPAPPPRGKLSLDDLGL